MCNPMTPLESHGIADHVSRCVQLAVLLEVSAYPKPGNVHRTFDFTETRYEHFLASAVAVSPHLRRAARRGVDIFKKSIAPEQAGVGETIKDAVSDVAAWQHDKNTLLGSIMLLSPMAVAAGITLAGKSSFSAGTFRRHLKSVVESTTSEDAVHVYDAIRIAQPGGLGKAPKLDVADQGSKTKILAEEISLHEVFKISAPWDSVAAEWVNNFHITFDIGYPEFKCAMKETGDINTATVQTFLRILSDVPDTLIARKAGKRKAEWASNKAKEIMKAGGMMNSIGRESVFELDRKLHDAGHRLNPGTTADLTSAVLAVAILEGFRP